MSDNNEKNMNFEQLMEQRLKDNFTSPQLENLEVSDERLKAMNKKLPSWDLEPPFSFLKK